MFKQRFILILLLSSSFMGLYASEYGVADIPTWVIPAEWDRDFDIEEYEEAGDYYHLYENQIYLNDGSVSQFRRHVIELTNLTGVENNSQISIDFDPNYEYLELHHIDIIRDGVILDRLSDADIDLFHRETDMDALLYDGTKTFHAILRDVRPGDVLDYAYSVEGINPVFEGKFSKTLWLEWAIKVNKVYYRLIHNSDSKLDFRYTNKKMKPEESNSSFGKEYIWETSANDEFDWDSDVPAWYHPLNKVEITEFTSWRELKIWAKELFEQDYPKAELEWIYSSIVDASMTNEEKLFAIVQWVQEEIRYLGLESGVDSHKPTTPDMTLYRRFGDCKDKSYLTVELLKLAEVESWPVLVETDEGKVIDERLPMTGVFNHCIVAADLGEGLIWIDPTDSYQRGDRNTFYQPNYYNALVLDDSSKTFRSMDSGPLDTPHQHFEYDIDVTLDEPELQITCISRFSDADYMRYDFDSSSKYDINESYKLYYEDYYPSIYISRDIEVYDNEESNEFITIEGYTIPDFWIVDEESGARDINIYPIDFSEYIYTTEDWVRTMPLEIAYPTYVTHKISVQFSDEQGAFNHDSLSIHTPYIEFDFSSEFVDQKLINTFSFKSLTDHVPAEDAESYLEDIQTILDKLDYSYYGEFTDEDIDEDLFEFPEIDLGERNYLPHLLLIILIVVLWRNGRKEKGRGYY